MKKFSFKNWIEKIQLVALRFPFTLFFLLGLSFLFILQINKHGIDIKPAKWVFFSLGIVLSLSVSLFTEKVNKLLIKTGYTLLAIILLMAYCWLLPEKLEAVHFYQTISIGIVLVLSVFVVPFFRKNTDTAFWEFSKTTIVQFIIAFIFAQVLFAGLSLAVLSLKELFKIDIQPNVYKDIAVICYVLFAPIYFLTNIRGKADMYNQEFKFDKFIKILGMYIFLPILALYSLILYVYLAQIVIKWQLPNGWVSMLVSVLGLGGFISMLILYPLRLEKENKIVNLLSKYFPILLLPLLALMSVGIFRRLGDYGITINRLYVLILNLWLYGICIYLFLSKANHLKWIIISFSSILFLSSVGPWSVYSITKRTLIKEIGQTLTESKLLQNGKLIVDSASLSKLDSTTSARLSEKIKYARQSYGKQSLSMYFKDSDYKLFSKKGEWFDLESTRVEEMNDSTRYFNISVEKRNQKMDVKPYSTLLILKKPKQDLKSFEDNDYLVIIQKTDIQVYKQKETKAFIVISLKQKIDSLIKNDLNQSAIQTNKFEISADKYKLIVTDVSLYFNKPDKITINNIDATLFLK